MAATGFLIRCQGRLVQVCVVLKLEALAEILEGERLIHSHCYRADEILQLLRLAEEFGFRIGIWRRSWGLCRTWGSRRAWDLRRLDFSGLRLVFGFVLKSMRI